MGPAARPAATWRTLHALLHGTHSPRFRSTNHRTARSISRPRTRILITPSRPACRAHSVVELNSNPIPHSHSAPMKATFDRPDESRTPQPPSPPRAGASDGRPRPASSAAASSNLTGERDLSNARGRGQHPVRDWLHLAALLGDRSLNATRTCSRFLSFFVATPRLAVPPPAHLVFFHLPATTA